VSQAVHGAPGARRVAVFGGSEPPEGHPEYEAARLVGRLLAGRGLAVLNGGYGGVMEGASRGAREAGGEAIGVTTDEFARRHGGNAWLSREIREPDLLLRTRTLLQLADGFVVLPGKAGTWAELFLVWALHRAGLLGARPVVLLGAGWEERVAALEGWGILEADHREVVRLASTPEETVALVALGIDQFERFRHGDAPS
jgi:uncharacterized protein (TIGR00730 family)